jgi:chromate transport protein ChrA
MIDMILNREKKAMALFFAAGFLKFAVIGAVFYLVSRISETAVLFYILGLSLIILAIFIEAIYQLYRSAANGRA